MEWPIIILLGALIPVSEAGRETGATELIAAWLPQASGRSGDPVVTTSARARWRWRWRG